MGILCADILILCLSGITLIDEDIFYNTFSGQLSYERTLFLFDSYKRISWISFIVLPIMLVIKFSLITMTLYIGLFFNELHDQVSLSSVFAVVCASEFVFIIAGLIKLLWFSFFMESFTLTDLNFFYPLSLINLFNPGEVRSYWIYPLQSVNLFHLLYILLLSYGLNRICNVKKEISEKIVLTSYLPVVVMWIALIMFLAIENPV